MKKLLLAIPLVAGGAWAGSSYFAGSQSESVYEDLLTQLDVMGTFVFEKESFDKGLTHSTAITAIRESTSPDAPIVVRLIHEIDHAALRFDDTGAQIGTATIKTSVAEDTDHPQYTKFRQYFTSDELIEITSTAGITGAIDSVVRIGAFEYSPINDDLTISIEPSNIELNTKGARTTAEGAIGQLVVSDESGLTMTWKPSTFTADATAQAAWIYDFDSLWVVDTVTLESPNLPALTTVKDVKIGAAAEPYGEISNNTGFFSFDSVSMQDSVPADTLPVTSGRLDIALNKLNIEAVKRYSQTTKHKPLDQQSAQSGILTAELVERFKGLITKDLELNYELALANNGGTADANYLLRFVGDESDTGYDTIVSAGDLLSALEMNINVKADKAALALTPALALLDSPQAQFVLVDAGDSVVAEATLKNMVGTLNDNEYFLDQMFGGMLSMPLEMLISQ